MVTLTEKIVQEKLHFYKPDLVYVKPDLVVVHSGSNDLKPVNSPEKIANEIILLALSVKGKGQQFVVSGIIPRA